jgi:tetratricopeptide (TPR) repeat protein
MDFIEYQLLKIEDNFIENGRYEEAIVHLKRLLNPYPANAEILFLLGEAYLLLGVEYQKVNKHGLAIECFTKANEIHPKINGLELRLMYSAKLMIKDEGLEKLNQYDIDENTLYKIRSKFYYDSELYNEAIAELKKLIVINPTPWPTYMFIAKNYQKIGDAEKAFSFYDKALSLDSNELGEIIGSLIEKSFLFIKCHNFKDASITLHRLLEMITEDIEQHLYSLDFIFNHDECDEVIKTCEQQIDRNPKNIHAILSKGIIFLLKRDFIEAKHTFSTAIFVSPKNPRFHFCFGVIFYLLEEPEKAIKSVLSACALDFTNNYYNTFYKHLTHNEFA